jgi:hypothetical protein
MEPTSSEPILERVKDFFWYDMKLWKVWDVFRRGIPTFFKNIWRFRRELYKHQWWDYRYTLEMLYRSLSIMVVKLEKDGIEVDESRLKKVEKIYRVLELLKHKLDDDYVDRAEKVLGEINWKPIEFRLMNDSEELYQLVDNDTPSEKEHISKVFKYAKELEDNEWVELWDTIKGKEFTTIEEYDGDDMRGWWD